MIRFCPSCRTERPIEEMFCEGDRDGALCDWPLSSLPLRQPGWRPAEVASPTSSPLPVQRCANGHAVDAGDLLCSTCGGDVLENSAVPSQTPANDPESPGAVPPSDDPADTETVIGEWRLIRRLATTSHVRERYEVLRDSDGREAILTLYAEGSEPDPEVYDVLRTLNRDHVPEVLETGHHGDRAYEVSEDLRGSTFADLGLVANDLANLSRIIEEVGGALAALAECGLRHRDLRPGAIMVRSRDPLDLVITGFGSARLSNYDLDIVSPLEITRYTAPEAVAGGVAAASDWWSLGMLILEQVTRGACFADADDQAFLINVLTNGAPIPEDLAPEVDALLRGLLSPDRRTRWCWPEIRRWLDGDIPEAPPRQGAAQDDHAKRSITLAGRRFSGGAQFALAAAEAEHWDEARTLLLRGELATWMEEAALHPELRAEIRQIAALETVAEDFRLALALKALNPSMPLVVRGEIVTPGWLMDHVDEGYALITGPVPDRLEREDAELWLARLKRRETRVRERARQLDVELDDTKLRTLALSTSKSRLAGVWEEQRRILPDTDHPGLLAIIERRITEEEDLILLLSAATSQFRTADAIVEEAEQVARRAGLEDFDPVAAHSRLALPRREVHAEIEARTEGFARCGIERIDEWADQFRLERRLPIARALAVLAVADDRWRQPPRQSYVATLLDFFARRITGSIMRGPLTRMIIGKTTARLDLVELDSARRGAGELLDHVLLRNDQAIDIDPAPLTDDPRIERRLRTLYAHATLYRRDTGIDGLYLGFPFLVMQEARSSTRPRIAPILLWPVRLSPEVGSRGRVTLAFDRDREEVRLNPAFETLLGMEGAGRWREAADEVLSRSSVNAAEVVEAFRELAAVDGRDLVALPSKDLKAKPGDDRVVCSAALFHLGFLGQAVMEDLRQLKAMPPGGSSLETAFRVGEDVERPAPVRVPELERYFTADSDPSQEAAVLEARNGRGLLIEGPPGTGKSQTIVNMVADAIGTGRSLLVVCQKQAALEVVHKRLDAAGLGERVVMVNDVNKDREPVIRAIREQLDDLFQRPHGATGWRQQRHQTAARIEALEQELDGQHRALHATDAQTGLSYRLILGDLIGLAREGQTPPLPSLRHLVGTLDPGQLAVLQEVCAPVARLWLPARYEESALADTRPFGVDDGTIETFTEDVRAFSRVEAERMSVIERTPNALTINDPEPYRAWSLEHGAPLLSIEQESRDRLARWLDRLAGASERAPGQTAMHAGLMEIEASLLRLPSDEAPDDAIEVARAMSDEELADWTIVSDRLLERPGLLERLNPSRWMASWRRRQLFKREGLADGVAFGAALHREESLRPIRLRLIEAVNEIGEPSGQLPPLRVPQLLSAARAALGQLAAAEDLVRRLELYPERNTAFAMARAASRQAVADLIEGIDQGLARHAARTTCAAALARLKPWMADDWVENRQKAIIGDTTNETPVGMLEQALPHVVAYQRFRARVPQLGAEAMAVFGEFGRIRERIEALPAEELEPTVRRVMATEARLAWKMRLEAEDPTLLLEASELEAKASSLKAADGEMRTLNRRLLVEGLDASRLRPLREWEDITRLRGVRAKRLREFVDKGADLGLMQLRPVWLVNPDVASRLLPLRKALFDTVIFDEASQMPIEYALPTLYRSCNMIVSGDEKQMPPTAFFASRVESDEAEIYDGQEAGDELGEEERDAVAETWNRREIKDCPDLLQLAKTVLPSTTLQIHYRSAYRELIQFSNASFYVNRLSVPARHPAEEIRRARPIEMIRAEGIYEDQTNRTEAERVADALRDLWRPCATKLPTVGVVTFNRKQADLIEEVLEDRAEQDAAFRTALTRERDRLEGGEDMGFFVKNVENVQGDERDVIIFSSTFGRNAQGTFRRFFGVLGQTGGERRLNVAVTRARQKVILVTSMPIPLISDLLSTRRQAVSPRDFLQAYFEYARCISDGDLEAAALLLTRLTPEQRRSLGRHDGLGDGLEEAVAAEIEALGWKPAPVSDDGAFGLDFAIEDPRTGLYGIGIECDAPRHGLLVNARAREMWRPSVLRRSIPVIHRVSSHRWFHEPIRERDRLKAAVSAAMEKRP
ncbi:histidine kinase [Sphingobium sp. C100]|uniref:AAA domain-containing protein n=1 Tax=Sphingobium sp. C100 TaxID=1207055 RepID=UPI0003D6506E|nr:AAA domain-containing protein [Sphingobium sp. C100]ETI64278.1 histidine kinase [Sphingobium sp. C100]